MQQTLELQPQQAQPTKVSSPTGIVFTGAQKMGLLALVCGLLYLRLVMRRRKRDHVCDHCGHRNPPHRSNCTRCSAPLFGVEGDTGKQEQEGER